MQSAANFDLWTIAEEPGDRRRIECGRHDQQLEIGAHVGLQATGNRQRQIGVECALVEFVEHDHADLLQQRIVVQHTNQQALGQHEDACVAASLSLKTDLIADLAPQGCPAFIGHPPRGGTSGETARLQHENLSLASQSGVQQRRWNAGRLAGPGRARRTAQLPSRNAAMICGMTSSMGNLPGVMLEV